MPTQQDIEELANTIAEKFHPQRIILFGFYVNGNGRPVPNSDLDVDLLIVLFGRGPGAKRTPEILQAIQSPFGINVLVRTSEEVERRLAMGDDFLQNIFEKGKVLYESARA